MCYLNSTSTIQLTNTVKPGNNLTNALNTGSNREQRENNIYTMPKAAGERGAHKALNSSH